MNVDGSTLPMLFQRGEIDFQNNFIGPDFLRYRQDPGFQRLLQIVEGTSPTYVFLNCELPPFTNRLVRHAMNYAVNKEALVRELTEEGCLNNAFYSSPKVQQLWQAAATELDADRRRQLYQQIERLIVEDAPWIFLCQMNHPSISQPWLKGVRIRGLWPSARLENCWIER